jgi:5-formyltetrahydrofolate cyclo-ligase
MNQKLYVLVRKDLPKSQQAVQAGHAVAEYLLRGPSTLWENGTLVYLGVRNEGDLKGWVNNIKLAGHKVVPFCEPDRNNELTAFATECSSDLVNRLKLL